MTENLDDQAARALIDWSMDLARRVAESTQDLPDEQAEVQVAQRGEAARRLIRAARDLAVASTNAGDIQAARGALPALPAPDTDPAQPETQAETPAAETSRAVPGPDRSGEAVQQVARHAQEVYGSSVQADQPEALQDRLRQAGAAPVERIAALRAFLESGAADQHLPFWHDDEKDRDW